MILSYEWGPPPSGSSSDALLCVCSRKEPSKRGLVVVDISALSSLFSLSSFLSPPLSPLSLFSPLSPRDPLLCSQMHPFQKGILESGRVPAIFNPGASCSLAHTHMQEHPILLGHLRRMRRRRLERERGEKGERREEGERERGGESGKR